MVKLTFRTWIMQWEDAHWYDKEIDDMVPLFNVRDVIEVQVFAVIDEIWDWKQCKSNHKREPTIKKQLSQSGPDESCFNIRGIVKKVYKPKKNSSYKRWEVLIDCGIPIIIVGHVKDAEKISIPMKNVSFIECNMIFHGAISFHDGKFFKPIAGKVLDIDETIYETPKYEYILITIDTSVTKPIVHKISYVRSP